MGITINYFCLEEGRKQEDYIEYATDYNQWRK
jgi:hypothetical protein